MKRLYVRCFMAKKKGEKEYGTDVYRINDKYFCRECNTELPLKQHCPICKKEVDWDRVFLELRR